MSSPDLSSASLPHGIIGEAGVTAAQALRESEQRMHLATEATGVGIWEWNLLTNEIRWDAQMFRLYGVAPMPEGIVPYSTWRLAVWPEDLAYQEEVLQETIRSQESSRREFRIRRMNDGACRHIQSVATVRLNALGQPAFVIGTSLDVTEHRGEEAALHASEERFRIAAAIVGSLVWTNNAEGQMEGEQPGWGDFTGQPPEAYQGYGWSQAVHPDDAQPTVDAWNQSVAEKRLFQFEHRVRRHDGEYRHCTIRAMPLLGADGAIREWVGVHTDVTEHRKAEAAEQRSAALFATLIEQSPGAVFALDGRLRFQQLNRKALEVFGPLGPLIGRSFAEIMDILWGAEVTAQVMKIFQHTLDTGERYQAVDFYERRVDLGVTQSYEWEVQRISLPMGGHGVVCYFTDVSERRRAAESLRASEEFKRSIIDSSPDCIKVLDLEGNLLSLEAGRDLLGIPDIKPYLGTAWIDLWVREEDRAAAHAAVAAAAAGRDGGFVGFFRTLHGHDKWWDVAISAMRDGSDKPSRLLAVSRDVTARHEMAQTLASQAAALRDADRSKDEFLAMLAHELRNPLAPLRNAAEIMNLEETNSEERQHAQNIIARQIDNMTRMIDDLLDVSRITHGKIELRKKPVALEEILTAATSVVRASCASHHQELTVSMPPEPIYLNADATRLEQVFGNLLGNASKYSGDGSHIVLRAERNMSAVPPEVSVSVSDNGIGISSELLPQIFDLFVQATRALDRAHGGLGIGLTLVQRLVKMHDGSIEAHSGGLGKGSEFIVRLPILREPPPRPAMPPRPPRETPRRILIVDDNTDSAQSLAMLQRRRGHETCTAFTGPEALTAALEFKPEVVLLDIGLPGMDGFEVAHQLRAMPWLQDVFLIAMSGYGSPEDRATAHQAGFDEYLVKPIDLAVLSQYLKERVAPGAID